MAEDKQLTMAEDKQLTMAEGKQLTVAEDKSQCKGTADLSFRNLIHFIPAGQISEQNEEKKKRKSVQVQDSVKVGKEIKTFYENLLSESEANQALSRFSGRNNEDQLCVSSEEKNSTVKRISKVKKINRRKPSSYKKEEVSEKEFFKTQTLDPNHRQHFKLLQSAQLGHIEEVQKLIKSGLYVNFQDFYGWTPLMCAANEGHSDVVKILLQFGADRSCRNSVGDNASSIAKKAGCSKLSDLILQYRSTETREKLEKNEESLASECGTYYCETCKREFALKEKKSHLTSTVHLFNSGKKKSTPSFLIPETNRGFQMLLRSGWSGDMGLGPEGKGAKYPVKTVLKRDRKGLGDEQCKKKAKITHFDAKDERAIESSAITRRNMSVKTLAKKAQKLKEKRERRQERNLRYELS